MPLVTATYQVSAWACTGSMLSISYAMMRRGFNERCGFHQMVERDAFGTWHLRSAHCREPDTDRSVSKMAGVLPILQFEQSIRKVSVQPG